MCPLPVQRGIPPQTLFRRKYACQAYLSRDLLILSRKKQALPATYKIIPQFIPQCKMAGRFLRRKKLIIMPF
jgi:hypothetical protein